jgi:predicted nucleic acid-binding protein
MSPIQVTVDDELAAALSRIDLAPVSKSRLVRDLALRGAQALDAERAQGAEALTVVLEIAAVCPVVALEILAGAGDEDAFKALYGALAALPHEPVTAAVCAAALRAARDLRGSRRLPAADYVIASAAAARGFGVLHLDGHFDTLASVLGFVSVRLDRA